MSIPSYKSMYYFGKCGQASYFAIYLSSIRREVMRREGGNCINSKSTAAEVGFSGLFLRIKGCEFDFLCIRTEFLTTRT